MEMSLAGVYYRMEVTQHTKNSIIAHIPNYTTCNMTAAILTRNSCVVQPVACPTRRLLCGRVASVLVGAVTH